MVKIFIGNLSPETEKDEIDALFSQYGTVTECAKYKNYAFVHMDDRKCATKAIRELHLHRVGGRAINVELSKGKNPQGALKLHVANVERGFDSELRELFEEYGTVTECAIIKNFAFVHMSNHDEAMDALQGLDDTDFKGKRIQVRVSKSRPKEALEEEEYMPPPPRPAYYPPPFPPERPEPPYRGRMGYPPPPPSPQPLPPPMRRAVYPGYGERSSFGVVDYYEKYRARPHSTLGNTDRRPIPPPPPPSALVRQRLGIGPYERQPLPPPSPYAVRDRSPIRRVLPPPAPSPGNGYSYERSRLSPLPRVPLYATPRPRDPYANSVPPPPPLPSRYASY